MKDFIYDNVDSNTQSTDVETKNKSNSINKKAIITNTITSDESYNKILNVFKNTSNSCAILNLDNDAKNGLGSFVHVIFNTEHNEVIKVIVPVFSSSKTVTWASKFIDTIVTSLTESGLSFNEDEISTKMLLAIFVYDLDISDYAFIQVCNATDFVKTGISGKNSYGNNINSYKWLNSLPDKTALKLSDLEAQNFKTFLINATTDQLIAYSITHAVENMDKYYNPSKRSEDILIKNIASGVYTEMKHASILISKFGEEYVNINNVDGDDKGVDITIELNNKKVNLDVKSTKSTNLSIRSKRTDTDFYAVYSTNSKYSSPKFFGYVSKNAFWGDEILKISEPTQYRDTFIKSLDELKPHFIQEETMLIHEQSKNRLREFKNKSVL